MHDVIFKQPKCTVLLRSNVKPDRKQPFAFMKTFQQKLVKAHKLRNKMFASLTFLYLCKEVIIHLLVYLVSDSLALEHSMNAMHSMLYLRILVFFIKM